MRPRRARARAQIGLDEIFDPDEDWIDWEEEESKSNSSKGPGTTTTPGKNNHTDRETEADDSLCRTRQHIGDEVFHCKTGIYNHDSGRDSSIQ